MGVFLIVRNSKVTYSDPKVTHNDYTPPLTLTNLTWPLTGSSSHLLRLPVVVGGWQPTLV